MMTTSLSGDLSHTPHPAFYITDTDFRFLFIYFFGLLAAGGRADWPWLGGCRVRACVRARARLRADKLLSGVHRGRFNEGPR